MVSRPRREATISSDVRVGPGEGAGCSLGWQGDAQSGFPEVTGLETQRSTIPSMKTFIRRQIARAIGIPVVGGSLQELVRSGWVPKCIWARLRVAHVFSLDLPNGHRIL